MWTPYILVIGEKEEAIRVSELLKSAYLKPEYVGIVSNSEKLVKDKDFVGNINQVIDIITIYNIDEVIFCSKNISHQMIIDKKSNDDIRNVIKSNGVKFLQDNCMTYALDGTTSLEEYLRISYAIEG